MDGHIEVNENLYHARILMDDIRELQVRLSRLDIKFEALNQMKDGDGSSSAHFQKVVDLYGVAGSDGSAKLTNAKTLYDEWNSAKGNSAALRQFVAKLG